MITIVGDAHAKPDNLDKINTLFDMVEDLGNTVVWLGDLLDTKEVVRARCLNTYLRRFKASNLQHYVLVGNHDLINLQSKEHSLEALKELENVVVIDAPTTIVLDKTPCRLYPYIHDVEIIRADLRDLTPKVVIGHFEIRSFDYGNGRICEEGLSLEDFKGHLRVFSGHFHRYSEEENIIYVGTPFSHSFGESNQTKYIALYDFFSDNLELIETPFPKHMTYEIDCSKHQFQKHLDEINHNRVILNGTQEQIDAFQKVDGVKYIEKPTTALKEAAVSEVDSPEVQFEKWATEIKGYSKDVLELGLEVLRDV